MPQYEVRNQTSKRIRTVIFITAINLIAFGISAQEFEGHYTGKLLTENNLLIVDKDKKGNYFVELHSSEKNNFIIDAVISDNKMLFLLPTLDGNGLEILCVKIEEDLQLSFVVDSEKHITNFKKIDLPRRNTVNAYFQMALTNIGGNSDQNLVGEWRLIGSFDVEEKPIKDEFYNKNYVRTFLKDGSYHEDPRFFWDLDKRHGLTNDFRPDNIPNGSWSTLDNQTLKLSVGGSNVVENVYKISSDTLRIFSPNGIRLIYVKRK